MDIWDAVFNDEDIPQDERYKVLLSDSLRPLYELAKQHGNSSALSLRADRDGGNYGETVGYVARMNLDSASSVEVTNLFEYLVRRRVPLEKILSEARVEKIR